MSKSLRKTKVLGNFLWTIETWETAAKIDKQDAITSSIFTISKYDLEFKWQLRLQLHNYLSQDIEISLVSYNKETVQASFKVFFINDNNERSHPMEAEDFLFTRKNFFKSVKPSDESIVKLLIKDELKILCELTISVTSTVIQGPVVEIASPVDSECSIKRVKELDDFEKLINNKQFSDVVFKVGRRQVYSHKVILAAKSPVFTEMFTDDTTKVENKQNDVIKVDLKYNTLLEMLRFIYTAKVDAIENVAEELLIAADRYSIQSLKNECEFFLSTNITLDNVFACLNLAIQCNASFLKTNILKFISSNKKQVLQKPEFKSLAKNDSGVLFEICQAFANLE